MAKVAGSGRKRPQLNIPVELLELDTENPRLAKESSKDSQFDLLQTLYEDFDVEELAFSMAENGYFDEEPIVVIPKGMPKGFKLSDNVEQQQQDLENLISQQKIKFVVVEGNRRTATLKLLTNPEARKKLKVGSDFPIPTKKALEDLQIIPAIFYPDRTDISAYLGVRHIAGLLKWEAYAKAVFLANRIEEGIKNKQKVDDSIREVQRQTADRSDVIRKQYLCYKILKEAEDDLSFDISNVKSRFSLIYVALNSPSIRNYIGVESSKTVDFSKRLVPTKKLQNLEQLLTWIFGNNSDKQPIITDSRKIPKLLAPVLDDEDATEYLLKYDNLEDAYERSGGEKKFFLKKINDATKNINSALSIGYKYKSPDVAALLEEHYRAVVELKKMVSNA